MTRDSMILSLIEAQWEMMSERDLRAMFINWMTEEYRELSDDEVRKDYDGMFN